MTWIRLDNESTSYVVFHVSKCYWCWSWIRLDNESTSYVVFHVSKFYWWWSWIQLDNESTSVCVSCVQVLLVVVAVRVSGVYY